MIWLLRHGPVRVAPGTCYGRSDVELREPPSPPPGLPEAATIVSSPARRCAELAGTLGAFTTDARLLELDFGAWEGLAWDAVPRAALDEWAADPWGFAPPGGENGVALLARVRAFWSDTAARPLVIVSHGGPLRLLRQLAEGRPLDILEPPPPLGAAIQIG